jgi:hypothetical protein
MSPIVSPTSFISPTDELTLAETLAGEEFIARQRHRGLLGLLAVFLFLRECVGGCDAFAPVMSASAPKAVFAKA